MIVYNVIFSNRALNDIEDVSNYYNLQKADLGKRFAANVEIALRSIKTNPYFASLRYNGIRCAKVKAFPFLVHYKVIESKKLVKILAVYNTHQKPLW